tara:strand:- start:22 stop:507 length:486 start_codon:yes stop_codon:yes gene_type:complete
MDNNNMNIKQTIQLLSIQDVTTTRQKKNNTLEFKLPVKDQYGAEIHVASFASGYVRRTKAGGHCPSWQLNKTKKVPPTKDYKWSSIERILIPNEQDRLEYLISFCLKNYYIGQANMLSNGNFIPKWKHEDKLKDVVRDFGAIKGEITELKVIANGHRYNVI